jgi:RNA polymerase sigma factor (sigma-70 family)
MNKASVAELVVGAQDGCKVTENGLLLHVELFKNKNVARMARRCRLTDAEIEDAQQEGVFWVLEAIRIFDARQPANQNIDGESGTSFHTFLFSVLSFRFKDFLKRQRRTTCRERFVSCETDEFSLVDEDGSLQSGTPKLATAKSDDPVHIVELREATEQLERAISQLDEPSQQIWNLLRAGVSLHSIAQELGISYEAVRRRRRRMIADIRSNLKEGTRDGTDSPL